ncbi:MAG: hypothetical protein HY725_04890 [Candidatus Rokubacteria bacterium]|nr:hypothetical protein [Candidatus Rokubacteria bacterium]
MLAPENVGIEPREEKDLGVIVAPTNLLREHKLFTNALQKRDHCRMALEDVSTAFIREFHRLSQDRWIFLNGHARSLYIGALWRTAIRNTLQGASLRRNLPGLRAGVAASGRPAIRTRGRLRFPAEVVLRLLLLKHIREWSFAVLEREVRILWG